VTVFCGVDWASDHHDVALVDGDGHLVARRRIGDDAAGFAELLAMLSAAGDGPNERVPVAIETPRGLLVASLRATGRPVYAINPMAASRYRERHSVARAKSDHADAMVLANILRTDAAAHRPLPADSELAQAVAMLARAQQDAVWRLHKLGNELRALLSEYFPTFVALFASRQGGITSLEARAVLALAPTPTAAAKLSRTRIARALRRAGRQRGIDTAAERIRAALRVEALHQLPLIEQAMGRHALALLGVVNAAAAGVDELTRACAEAFRQHPDHAILTSFPGLADITGARVLAEIGDDRTRFDTARALRAYAGSAPVTRASGRVRIVVHRRVKNQRLAAVGFVWAFASLSASPGARAHYDRRRAAGARHAAAQRHLFNRMLSALHHCLTTRATNNETRAFSVTTPTPEAAA
jgi:transposase